MLFQPLPGVWSAERQTGRWPVPRSVSLDLANPYKTGNRVALDFWMGYKMKICDDKYDLSFQLNVKDALEGGGFRAITANGDGRHSVFRIVQPRSVYLTTTVEF